MENANYYEENGLIHVSFQFFGKKDKGFRFHQPGICDGGWIISGHFDPNERTYKVRYSEDSFACSRLKSEISFEPKKNVDYVVYLGKTKRGIELCLKDKPFKYVVRPKTPEELEQERLGRIRRSEELRKQRGLPDGEITPDALFPLIIPSNPTLIRNKNFTEFPKETSSKESIYYVHDLDNYTVGEHNCLSMTFDEIINGGFGVYPEPKNEETEFMLAKAIKSFCKKIFKKGE